MAGPTKAELQAELTESRSELRKSELRLKATSASRESLESKLQRKDATLTELYEERSRLIHQMSVARRALIAITDAGWPRVSRTLTAAANAALEELNSDDGERVGV